MSIQTKKHILHAHGMHCKSCVLLIEDALSGLPGIKHVTAQLNNHTVAIETSEEIDSRVLAETLTPYIEKNGYTLEIEREQVKPTWKDFKIALPIAFGIMVVFVILQKVGLVNLIQSDTVSYPLAFLIGIIASLSSCLAVVGGLLLSISATYAKTGEKAKPQIMFHVGRLIAFFVLGGVIGALGSAFTLNVATTVILNVLIGLIMFVLGLNLLDVFPWAKRLQLHMPKFLSSTALKSKNLETSFGPFLIGVATFFLPCGFTQSMQFYSLTTGSFLTGALTMTAFALGTLPVLGLISFTSLQFSKGGVRSRIFFKTAGLLVIAFAVLSIVSALGAAGIIPPLLNI